MISRAGDAALSVSDPSARHRAGSSTARSRSPSRSRSGPTAPRSRRWAPRRSRCSATPPRSATAPSRSTSASTSARAGRSGPAPTARRSRSRCRRRALEETLPTQGSRAPVRFRSGRGFLPVWCLDCCRRDAPRGSPRPLCQLVGTASSAIALRRGGERHRAANSSTEQVAAPKLAIDVIAGMRRAGGRVRAGPGFVVVRRALSPRGQAAGTAAEHRSWS